MGTKIFVYLALVAVGICLIDLVNARPNEEGQGLDTTPTEKCPQGIKYKVQCNRCGCNPESGDWWCTRIGCISGPWSSTEATSEATSEATTEATSEATTEATSGESSEETSEATSAVVVNRKRLELDTTPTEKCPKGIRYKDECNRCTCRPESGDWWCTKIGCNIGRSKVTPTTEATSEATTEATTAVVANQGGQELDTTPTEKCPQGIRYKDKCNKCGCNPESGDWWCTKMGCISGPWSSTEATSEATTEATSE